MQPFMGKDFMLKNETAKHLFHTYSEDLPIIDYHCHIPPQEIYEDRRYNNIAEVWLGGKAADGIITSGVLCVPTVCRKMS